MLFRSLTNTAFGRTNSVYTHSNVIFGVANAAYAHANASYTSSNLSFSTVNAAYGLANTALQQAGGSVTGDLTIAGNLTISGMTTYANTQTLNIGDSLFTLNADLPAGATPSENSGMEVNRGNLADVSILWNEAQDWWTLTNDGTT